MDNSGADRETGNDWQVMPNKVVRSPFRLAPYAVGFLILIAYFWMFFQIGQADMTISAGNRQVQDDYRSVLTAQGELDCGAQRPLDQAGCREEVARRIENFQIEGKTVVAQQEMSEWAFWALLLAPLQLLATLIGLLFIRGTLVATNRSVDASVKATEQLIRQTDLTENSIRPWVVGEVELKAIKYEKTSGSSDNINLNLGMTFKNIGKSVARDVSYKLIIVPSIGCDYDSLYQNVIEKVSTFLDIDTQYYNNVPPNGFLDDIKEYYISINRKEYMKNGNICIFGAILCKYRIHEDGNFKHFIEHFSIGDSDPSRSRFTHLLIYNDMTVLNIENVVIRRMGNQRLT